MPSSASAPSKRLRCHLETDAAPYQSTKIQCVDQAARHQAPDMRITTDIIVGFPGETGREFADSEAFIQQMDFAGLHVFRYSKRPGTAAARMRGHLAEDIKKERSARLIAWSSEAETRYAQQFVGKTLPVLWEHVSGATEDGFMNVGYTDNYIRVRTVHPRLLTDHITLARMERYEADQMQVKAVLD